MTEPSQDRSLSLPDLGLRPRNLRPNRLQTFMDDRIGACGDAVLNEGATFCACAYRQPRSEERARPLALARHGVQTTMSDDKSAFVRPV